MKAGAGHERTKRNPARDRRDPSELGPRFPGPAGAIGLVTVQEMVANPDGVEADLLTEPNHGRDFRPANLAFHLGQLEADLQRTRGARPA